MRQATCRLIMAAMLASTTIVAHAEDDDSSSGSATPPAAAPREREPAKSAPVRPENRPSSEPRQPRAAASGSKASSSSKAAPSGTATSNKRGAERQADDTASTAEQRESGTAASSGNRATQEQGRGASQGQSQGVGQNESGPPPRSTGAPRGTAPPRPRAAAAPRAALLASCQELQNTSGIRMLIHVPSARNARLGIFDRSSNRELDRDVLGSSSKNAVGYARIQWGTRMMPSETLLSGAFLISASERDRYYQGTILADNGDGGLFVRTAHLGPSDDGSRQRWTLRLGSDRTLACRMGRDAAEAPQEAAVDREPRKRPRRE